jgi:subtilisin family serine protease
MHDAAEREVAMERSHCRLVLLLLVAVWMHGAHGAPRILLPHEENLLLEAAKPGGTRLLVTLRTATAAAPATQQQRGDAIADAHVRFTAELSGFNMRMIRKYAAFPIVLANFDSPALQHVLELDDVVGVQADHMLRPLDNQSDAVIGAPLSWQYGFTGYDEVVAVLDTGVQESHPFLSASGTSSSRVIPALEGCFSGVGGAVAGVTSLCPAGVYSETGDPGGNLDGANCDPSIAQCDHGTHVAGIVAGTGNYSGGNGENGVAVGASLMPVQVFSCNSSGGPCVLGSYDSDVISALGWVHDRAINSTYRIAAVNLSLGISGSHYTANCDSMATAYKSAIDTLRDDHIATVISSGNDSFTDGVDYPACISSAVSVAATDNSDAVASYSNSAPFVSLYAPGAGVYSSIPVSGYGYMSGTSMAAPQVSGALAVLQSKFSHQATVEQLLTILQKTGKAITANGYTRPRVDIGAAADDVFLDGFGD